VRFALVFPVLALTGCFLGYDSRWGQETTAQKHNAEAARPASLTPVSSAGPTANAAHVFKVRIWATAQFTAQTMDWKHETREILDSANTVLLHAASTRLEIASMESWPSPPSQEDLLKTIQGLRAHDKGDDVSWVIGLVGSFPTYTSSYHDLGMGHMMGRHLVLRAASDLGEHEAAEAAFDKLDPSARLQLVAERKRHRSVATLLHEIGHTLGAVHETGTEDFMGPAYSKTVHTFGPEATAVVKIGIAHRDETDPRPFGKDLLRYYEAATTPWIDKERTGFVAELRTMTAGFGATVPVASGSASTTPASKPAFTEVPSELKDADRTRWSQTSESFRAGKMKDAWETGTPLFSAYPSVLAVQDLRCQIAMKIGFDWQRVKLECEKLMQLSTTK